MSSPNTFITHLCGVRKKLIAQGRTTAIFGGKRNNDIEILRGIAIIYVLLDHFLDFWNIPGLQRQLSNYVSFWGGVDIFFAISGFVISQSILRSLTTNSGHEKKLSLFISFWIKRVWRLWPAAWIWLVIPFFVAFVAIPHMQHGQDLRANLSYVIGGILSVVNFQEWAYFNHNGMQSFLSGPYWSLSLEEQFYFVVAPLLLFLRRKYLVILLFIIIAVQFPIVRNANTDNLAWYIRSDAFSWGVLLAIFWSGNSSKQLVEPTLLRYRRYALPLTLFILLSIAFIPQLLYSLPFGVGIISILSGLLVYVASYDKGYLGLHGFFGKLLSWVGDRSYAIYLVSSAVLAIGLRVGPLAHTSRNNLPDLLLTTVAFMLLTLIIAEISYRVIEVPARLRGRKLSESYSTRISRY